MSTPRDEFICWVSAAAIFFVAIICIIWVSGCAPGKPAEVERITEDVTACSAEITKAIFASGSCNEAQFKTDALLKTNAKCVGFEPFDVCALLKGDGGMPLVKDGGSR